MNVTKFNMQSKRTNNNSRSIESSMFEIIKWNSFDPTQDIVYDSIITRTISFIIRWNKRFENLKYLE